MPDPHNPMSATGTIIAFGYRLWVRLLGKRRAAIFVGVGMAVSTMLALILEARG
jgi:hypothetical protein